jgi:hypothetical protein
MAAKERVIIEREVGNPEDIEAYSIEEGDFDKEGLALGGGSYKDAGFKIVRFETGEEYPRKASSSRRERSSDE